MLIAKDYKGIHKNDRLYLDLGGGIIGDIFFLLSVLSLAQCHKIMYTIKKQKRGGQFSGGFRINSLQSFCSWRY